MDGKGPLTWDNIFVERLVGASLKYEEVYLNGPTASVARPRPGIGSCLGFL